MGGGRAWWRGQASRAALATVGVLMSRKSFAGLGLSAVDIVLRVPEARPETQVGASGRGARLSGSFLLEPCCVLPVLSDSKSCV